MDSCHFKNRSHRPSCYETSSFGSRLQENPTCAILSNNLIGNRPIGNGNFNHAFLGPFHALSDRLRDLMGLSQTGAHRSMSVSNDDYSTEPKPPPALDDFGCSVNCYDSVKKF